MSRVLLVGPPFFGYLQDIAAELELLGHEVDYANDRPSDNGLEKAVLRVWPRLLARRVAAHSAGILRASGTTRYDHILLVNVKAISAETVAALRRQHPGALVVLYLWDAMCLYPQFRDLIPLADRAYTFDSCDAAAHGLLFRPLFFNRAFGAIGRAVPPASPGHDLVNVCTAHPNRYEFMRRELPGLAAQGIDVHSYLYVHPLQYAFNRVRVPEFRDAPVRDFRFTPLPPAAYQALVASARGVFDMNHSAQTGLTMRAIETIGARRKLVTTNARVRDYRFYDPTRVLVCEGGSVDAAAVKEFLLTPSEPMDPVVYDALSLRSWCAELLWGGGEDGAETLRR